ncbi:MULTISPECIES: chorismate synthase [Aneurinibacillus]|uniref:Chorismate synthase n=1 Tax=Aneurinibacillus thermoaerophilus TaxID=143495 RepID=A0ABX8YE03_ANETH|nr:MULTISPECIES: chorismate synthase [Aneurinibacillus]AMA73571.1 chorismate synthase [Aneurinibacillus sp. XH2]MED0679637.1 chorismate synthase [Aneurinibacillus thermoaerophilus]MED0737365.1 chorismate synthase [Aneurinibacillus thermoaerophilus]MED0756214.1 chorismate synthase [Aneurinibacillus thermoaerophilus]MED0760351.1 chorismate synthase [Aneurinibacillus thermoaerophilus]
MRYLTAGESHGPQLTAIIEGIPSNLPLSIEKINEQLLRRMKGYGRGRRMQIEKDQVKIVGGVRHGKTTGAPICLVVENKDWTHWQQIMSPTPVEEGDDKRRVSRPRPGHADLNGALKYNQRDMRNILERSSARETAIRVAVGAVARQLLEQFDIKVAGHVLRIGEVEAERVDVSLEEMMRITEESPVRCLDSEAAQKMMERIDKAKADGDSLGGIVEVIAEGLPVGLGSHVQWDRKLDGRLAQAVMSIQAFKGVEIGIGFEAATRPGSQVHDEIILDEQGNYSRKTNRAGGLEGGMTTGMPVVVRGVMKPIPTLYKPLNSVDIDTKETFAASIERSDSCAVPAASVVAEAVVCWTLADALVEKFGGDSLEEMKKNYESYRKHVERF